MTESKKPPVDRSAILKVQWLDALRACDGFEVPREAWKIVQGLVDDGLAEWRSRPRGPRGNFRRAVPIEKEAV